MKKSKENERVELGYEKEDEYASKFIEMHIIELPKFKEKNPEIGTKLEQWLWLFVGGDEKVKKASKVNKEIERINKKLASMSLSQEERNNYEFRLKAIRDEISAINYATQKGLEQGIEQGIEQERKQAKAEKKGIAKKLLKKGLSIEEVTEITGLTQEEIKEMETKE